MTDKDMGSVMWASFLQYAIGQTEWTDAFTAETGMLVAPDPKAHGLAAMIDKACGRVNFEMFVVWVTVRLWGFTEAPDKFQDRIKELRAAGKLPWVKDEDLLMPNLQDIDVAIAANWEGPQ